MYQDFRDLLSVLNAHGVEYIVVGAHALAAHGLVRATKDLDVWVRPERRNAERMLAALKEFGVPLHGLTEADLVAPDTIFQIGVPPLRIDILTAIGGVEFGDAWADRVQTRFGGEPAAILSREDLIRNKRTVGRPRDRLDVKWLERHRDRQKKT